MLLEIVFATEDRLPEYEAIPATFVIEARLRILRALESGGRMLEADPHKGGLKDYDAYPKERPSAIWRGLGEGACRLLLARKEGSIVGGAFLILEGESAVLHDIRVHPISRGKGVGRSLFKAALMQAKRAGCTSLVAETQDINVSACRFYRAMGCVLVEANPNGYGEELDEAKLIWQIRIN